MPLYRWTSEIKIADWQKDLTHISMNYNEILETVVFPGYGDQKLHGSTCLVIFDLRKTMRKPGFRKVSARKHGFRAETTYSLSALSALSAGVSAGFRVQRNCGSKLNTTVHSYQVRLAISQILPKYNPLGTVLRHCYGNLPPRVLPAVAL